MSNSFFDLPIATIEKALEIRKKIEALQASVAAILGGASDTPAATPVVKDRRKGKRSAAARAKMAAAQKARWAKKHAAQFALEESPGFGFQRIDAAAGAAGHECVDFGGDWARESALEGIYHHLHRLLRIVLADSGFLYNEGD